MPGLHGAASGLATWIALLLLAATTAIAFVPLDGLNTALNMAIALAKGLLVAWVFMRLGRTTMLIRIFAAAAVFTLGLLFALSSSDYATRPAAPAPWYAPR